MSEESQPAVTLWLDDEGEVQVHIQNMEPDPNKIILLIDVAKAKLQLLLYTKAVEEMKKKEFTKTLLIPQVSI